MAIFVGSIITTKRERDGLLTRNVLIQIEAGNEHEAIGKSYTDALQQFPVQDGWAAPAIQVIKVVVGGE